MRRAGATARATARTIAPTRAHDLGNAHATWARQGKVATSFWHRDLDWRGRHRDILWCCDLVEIGLGSLRSRLNFEVVTWFSLEGVATWIFEVATGWKSLRSSLGSLPEILRCDLAELGRTWLSYDQKKRGRYGLGPI